MVEMVNKQRINKTNKQLPCNSALTTNSAALKPSNNEDSEEVQKFDMQLCWCVHKLQIALKSGKLNPKQVKEHSKNLNILMSTKSTLVKKRQIMSLMFGNYREKMEMEENKLINGLKKLQVKVGVPCNKSLFLKKSSFMHCDFRSNFNNEYNENTSKLPKDIKIEEVETDSNYPCLNCNLKFIPSDNSFKFNF